jgi:NAD(P)-dependent dehydrogenase (short-subunit alcohol dehydrogenase family)
VKVILITGTTSGFGKLIAEGLVKKGHRVYGTYLPNFDADRDALEFPMLELDVTDDASVDRCVTALVEAEGRIDVLINNAGVSIAGALEDTAVDEARWQMEVNFFGPLRMIRAVLPHMRSQGRGRVLTTGSMAGHVGLPYQSIYSAAKYALEGVNEALRLELSGSGIDSAVICPGDFNTGFTAARVYTRNAHSATHAQQLAITMGIAEKDEQNSPHPDMVADLVVGLVDKPSLKVRYFVGSIMQRVSIFIKWLLPASVFESIMRSNYKLP